jgi:hypothetical protein
MVVFAKRIDYLAAINANVHLVLLGQIVKLVYLYNNILFLLISTISSSPNYLNYLSKAPITTTRTTTIPVCSLQCLNGGTCQFYNGYNQQCACPCLYGGFQCQTCNYY